MATFQDPSDSTCGNCGHNESVHCTINGGRNDACSYNFTSANPCQCVAFNSTRGTSVSPSSSGPCPDCSVAGRYDWSGFWDREHHPNCKIMKVQQACDELSAANPYPTRLTAKWTSASNSTVTIGPLPVSVSAGSSGVAPIQTFPLGIHYVTVTSSGGPSVNYSHIYHCMVCGKSIYDRTTSLVPDPASIIRVLGAFDKLCGGSHILSPPTNQNPQNNPNP